MSTSSDVLIKLEGVTKVFYTDEVETHALAGIHLEIRNGEYLAIAGPSGCGKSTLLSILGLLDTPTDGTYMLNGRPVANLTAAERARIRNREIGFIFQSFNLIGDLTVYENVELPLTYRGMQPAERKEARRGGARAGRHGAPRAAPAQPALRRSAAARRRGARRGRRPAILLADEPTGNLDSKNGEAVMELLQRAAPRRRHHLHGHARSALRAARRSLDPPVRRPHRRGERRRDGVARLRGQTLSGAVAGLTASDPATAFLPRSTAMTSTSPAPAGYSILERMPQTPVISLKNIEKFYQHGLQRTYVLRRISLDFEPGEFVSIMGPSGAGKSTLLHILGHARRLVDRRVLPARRAAARARQARARGAAEEAHRLRVPELSPARRPDGLREPRHAALVPRREEEGARQHGLRHARPLPDRRQEGSLPVAALGRTAAARRRGARADREAEAHPGRRADRQPALGAGPRDHGAVPEAERRRDDDHPGDALGDQRRLRHAHHPPEGRLARDD